MALNFPTSPTLNQTYTYNGKTWKWDGTAWVLFGPTLVVSGTAPTTPADGTMWWDTESGMLKIRYNDGTTTQWVDAAPQGPQGAAGPLGDMGAYALDPIAATAPWYGERPAYILGQVARGSNGGGAGVINTFYCMPFSLSRACTLDSLGIHVTQSAACNIRLAVYSRDTVANAYKPLTRLVESGVISLSSTGLRWSGTLGAALAAGHYWIAYVQDSTGGGVLNYTIVENSAIGQNWIGQPTGSPAAQNRIAGTASFTYAELPTTAPTITSVGFQFPCVFARFSA